jgi:hypothetical protein
VSSSKRTAKQQRSIIMERQRRREVRKKSDGSVLQGEERTPPRGEIKSRRSRILQQSIQSSSSNQSLLSAASYEKSFKMQRSPARETSPIPRIRVPSSYSYEAQYTKSSENIGINVQPRELPIFDAPPEEENEVSEFDPNVDYDCTRLAMAERLILRMFMDENSSDIKFVVSDNLQSDVDSVDAAPPQIFHSHRFILEECAPFLAELCETNENCDGGHTIVPIDGVDPEVFHRLLYHVYGGKISDWAGCAKKMVDLAEKYNLSQLKLEAEEAYAESAEITVDNLLNHILYADTRKSTAFKDRVIDFILDNEEEVSDKVSISADEGSRALVWYW